MADGVFFVFCSKNIVTKLVGYEQATCLCVEMEFVFGTICFHVNCIHFRGAVFIHVGRHNCVRKWCFVLHV